MVIALAGLSLVGIPFLTVMGLAAAGTVAVSVLVAVTLLPALLGFAGRRVLPRKARLAARLGARPLPQDAPQAVGSGGPGSALLGEDRETAGLGRQGLSGEGRDAAGSGRHGLMGGGRHVAAPGRRGMLRRAGDGAAREPFGFRWARGVVRRRVLLLVVGVLGLGALAAPALDMRLALPDASAAPVGSPVRAANDLITEGFGPGFTGRLALVVSTDDKAATSAAVEQVRDRLAGTENLLAVTPPNLSQDGRTALLGVLPRTGPTDPATETLVHDVRDKVHGVAGADVALTGQTAVGIDVSEKLSRALPTYLLLVVGLSVLLLAVVFRSILVPVKAALGFLLTVGATFGLTTLVFQQGHLAGLVGLDTPGPLVSFLPILLIGILFGLAMDYEVFLVSRMREDFVHGDPPTRATINGMGHGARVVTAAALIMTAVFAGFILLDDPVIKSMGFALAVGVAIDAFVVRMTLVPAVMSLLGRSAWWLPRWLDRALPDVDLEGAKLRRHLDADTHEPELAAATSR
ncbi:hypothetical protein Asi02nite_62530 [Asanoa siamensis]|uniref:Membrane transport protein MMPL domain-containing protein n=1 Tax=Asanoa siamensis TaxID=926357 RepID=A0ABQ4CZM6_9ACTN|nr:hypothetical protein Asi02nite_62530 [Asanoa siamensis]